MKQILAILSVLLTISHQTAYADWVDDYFTGGVYTAPQAFESQQRGYYTLGGYSARIPHKAEPIMTITMPSLSAGCGGIDMFWGGVSFMNAEYLLQKAQGVMANAPYVAFSIGLKAISTQFGDTIEAVQAIIDQLNSMQIDECAAAKGIMQIAMGEEPALVGEFSRLKDNTEKLIGGVGKTWNKVTNDTANNPVGSRNDATDAVDPKLKKLLQGKGYFLDVLVNEGELDKNAAEAIRALVGDVYFDNTQDIQIAQYRKGCAKEYTLNNYIMAQTPYQSITHLQNTPDAECEKATQSIMQRADQALTGIYDAYTTQTNEMSPAEVVFIQQADLPVLSLMSNASVAGDDYLKSMQMMLSSITAASFAYGILNDLKNNVLSTISTYEKNLIQEENYTDIIVSTLSKYIYEINQRMHSFENEYSIKLQNFYTTFSLSLKEQSAGEDLQKVQAESIMNN